MFKEKNSAVQNIYKIELQGHPDPRMVNCFLKT